MLLAVQEVLFCISVTAAGAGWFPHTNCTEFPQYLHSNPNQGLAVSVPPSRVPSGAGFPTQQLPWTMPFQQEPEEEAALSSHRSESPRWFWGLPVSYFEG